MNIAILTGNLGRDPEPRQVGNDTVLNFPIGVQTGTRDKPSTMWVDCALWGKRATSLEQYLAKGARVTVSGSIRMEEYQAKDGTTKSRLRLSVDQIDLPPRADQSPTQHQQDKSNGYQPQSGGTVNDLTDDIPF